MLKMWDWYYVPPSPVGSSGDLGRYRQQSPKADDKMLFRDALGGVHVGGAGVSNATRRLQNLWDNVLPQQDEELHKHLSVMDVIPTTFGTNWTKLLFSRQFSDYLVIWDAVIASAFVLVDYVVVAMVR